MVKWGVEWVLGKGKDDLKHKCGDRPGVQEVRISKIFKICIL